MASKSRTPLIAGNWKMNMNHLEAIQLVQKVAFALEDGKVAGPEVAVLTPFTDIRSVQTTIDGDKLSLVYGAQDISVHEKGAYTGEISGAMLSALGCSYVIVGHSERRQYHNETDEVVNAKLKAVYANGMIPIFCLGEPLEVRKAGTHVEHCLAQLEAGLAGLSAEQVSSIVVAYEPIWAIGTGETATDEDAQEVCGALRTKIADLYSGSIADGIRILYGGSMNDANAAGLLAKADIDGGLIGGAALVAEKFVAIAAAAAAAVK